MTALADIETTPQLEFHRRVLDYSPAPTLVVDQVGQVLYANRAMAALGGWTIDEAVGMNILDHIYPDDIEWVADAFVNVVTADDARHLVGSAQWASISMRIVTKEGKVVPIEVTGAGGLSDPMVGGVIFDVRPVERDAIIERVLAGLAAGEPVQGLLELAVDMITLPPLDLDVVMLELPDGRPARTLVASQHDLGRAVSGLAGAHWLSVADPGDPAQVAVRDLPSDLAGPLIELGYSDVYVTDVPTPDHVSTYVLVACTPTHWDPAHGPKYRLSRARELIAITLLRAYNDQLMQHAALHDALTKLPNRRGLQHRFEQISHGVDGCSLFYIDLDNFKPVNDAHGHSFGDQVLAVVVERLRNAVRARDLVARVGGDEFAVLVPGPSSDRERLDRVARRILRNLSEPITIGAHQVVISASIGIARAQRDATLEDLLRDADEAMYEAKRNGGASHRQAPFQA